MGMVPWEVQYFQQSCCQIDSYHFFLSYGSTATLIMLTLVNGSYSPHKILYIFVKNTTSFRPTDGEKWHADEPDVNNLNFDLKEASRWHFDDLGV